MRKKKYLYQIYKITNILNNKIYIGLTVQGAKVRYLHHLYEARSNSNFPIHNSIRKYGEENFKLEVLVTVLNPDILKEIEIAYIKFYNSNNREFGYNLTKGGDGTLGKYHSEETKNKIRNKAINRQASIGTKLRMSESHSNIEHTGIPTRKEIAVYDSNNNYIGTYKSLNKAGKYLNISHQGISNCILKNKESYKGYIFKIIN